MSAGMSLLFKLMGIEVQSVSSCVKFTWILISQGPSSSNSLRFHGSRGWGDRVCPLMHPWCPAWARQ